MTARRRQRDEERVSGLEAVAVAVLLVPAIVLIGALWWLDVLAERDRLRRRRR